MAESSCGETIEGVAFETIRVDASGGIATITLDRPDRMNAFTRGMMEELIRAFDLTDADPAVRVVIVTAAGTRAFCAGADLESGADTFDYGTGDAVHRDLAGLLTLRIFDSLKPVIAAVNGAAVGVGATMQLAMDIRIASTGARFGFVFPRRGLVPEGAASWFLPQLVGLPTALEWTLTGRLFDADEALRKGLVHSVHAPEDLLAAARAIAQDIADNCAPVSVTLTRHMMWRLAGAAHPMMAHRIDSRAITALGAAGDAREGVTSFLEKRPAAFSGRVPADLPPLFPWWQTPEFE